MGYLGKRRTCKQSQTNVSRRGGQGGEPWRGRARRVQATEVRTVEQKLRERWRMLQIDQSVSTYATDSEYYGVAGKALEGTVYIALPFRHVSRKAPSSIGLARTSGDSASHAWTKILPITLRSMRSICKPAPASKYTL